MSEAGECTTCSVFIRKSFRSVSSSASVCFGIHGELLRCFASCLRRMRVWAHGKTQCAVALGDVCYLGLYFTVSLFLWIFPQPLARRRINVFEELICDM